MFVLSCCLFLYVKPLILLYGQNSLVKEIVNVNENIPGKIKFKLKQYLIIIKKICHMFWGYFTLKGVSSTCRLWLWLL